jgi:hypothetical protein
MPGGDARPLVLAHKRFHAARRDYDGLTLAERFDRIHSTNLWGAAETRSGLGSEAPAMAAVRAALPGLFARLGITSVLDAPCGDAGWITIVPAGVGYVGVDIVPAVVAGARARFPAADFRLADITADPLPLADAILCRDCLVHLSFANITRALATFRESGATWLLTTTFTDFAANRDCTDGDWRALNFTHAPFDWPAPVTIIDEACTEGDGGWADKAIGVWRLADVPVPR